MNLLDFVGTSSGMEPVLPVYLFDLSHTSLTFVQKFQHVPTNHFIRVDFCLSVGVIDVIIFIRVDILSVGANRWTTGDGRLVLGAEMTHGEPRTRSGGRWMIPDRCRQSCI